MPHTPVPTPAIEELLAQPAWIRELARSLVADRSRADDLVQASWLAALRGDSTGVRDARRWFARILRNQASKDRRRARQRAAREESAAQPEALPSTADLVAEVSEQHALTAHLLGLEPRSREVLLLRFYRGLSRSAAAAELGVSPNTLDSRQSRALELLRTRLDSEYGDRKSWCLALAPLAIGGRATAAGQGLLHTSGLAWIGGLFMMIKTHSSAALLITAALAASLVLKLALDDGLGPGGADTSVGLLDLGMRLPDEAPDEARPSAGRLVGGASAPQFITEVDSCTTLTGSLIDSTGKPLHGIRVAWVQAAAGARKREVDRTADDRAKLAFELVSVTDSDGQFELGPIPEGEAGEVVVIGYARESEIDGLSDFERDWMRARERGGRRAWDLFTLGMGERVEVDGTRSLVGIVVAMASLEFKVHSPDGQPIEAARIACPYSIRTVRGLDFRLEAAGAGTVVQTASTDKRGRAVIERAPYYLGAVVEIRAEGYRTKTLSLADPYRNLGDIELIPLGAPDLPREQARGLPDEAAVIRGRVENPSGQPVEGALVRLGSNAWVTNAQGQFGADRVIVADLASPILAIARPGFAPFVTDALELLGNTDPDHFTTFTLDDTPLSIQGHINVTGENYSGFRVELIDSIDPGGSGPVEVDASGAFELGGLAAREYRRRIWNAERGIFFESAPLPAGASGVLISVPDKGQRPAIAVRVVHPEGGPFEGARLSLHFASSELEALGARILFSEPFVTDAKGKVKLERLPMADLVLEVEGVGLEGASVELKANDPLNMLEVALEPLDYMRLNVPPARRAGPWNTSKLAPFDEATALDAAGSPLPMIYIDNFGRRVSTERLRSGLFGFPDFLVGSGFVELVMYAEGVDMSRVSVVPQSPFGINLVDI